MGLDWYTHTQEQGRPGFHCLSLSLPYQRKGLAFVFQVLGLVFSPCFLIAKSAIGVEHGEGGREQNLVNSWGLSLFIAGLGEMWLTE